VFPSDLPGVNPATLNGIHLYYRLMTKWSDLGDSTELSRVGLSHHRYNFIPTPVTATDRVRRYNSIPADGESVQCPIPTPLSSLILGCGIVPETICPCG
jgi:hypothetical protein